MTVRPLAAVLAATAATVLLPLTAAATASAERTARPLPEPFDATHLRLTTQPVGDRAMGAFTYLNCDPVGGTHPAAESACTDLTKVDGRFEDLGDKQGACTMQYAPVELRATGTWRGKPVDYVSEVFANPCVADLATGGNVFNF